MNQEKDYAGSTQNFSSLNSWTRENIWVYYKLC